MMLASLMSLILCIRYVNRRLSFLFVYQFYGLLHWY